MCRVLLWIMVFCLSVGILPATCLAEDINPDSLTIEEAVNLALSNSKELEKASLEVDAAKVTRDEAWDAHNAVLMQTYIPGQDMYLSVPTGQELDGLVYTTNFAWLAKKKEYEAKVDSVVLSVHQKYCNVLTAREKVESQRLAVQRDEEKLRIAKLRYQLGLNTVSDVSRAKMQVADSQAKLETAEKELEQRYIELAEYLGLPEDSRPTLVDEIEYASLEVENVDNQIDSIASNSPSVWVAEEAVRLEKQTYGKINSYDLDKVELDKAEVGVDITKKNIREITRNIYYAIKQLEDSYTAALEAVQAAEEALRVAQLMFDVGMATEADVLNAEAALASARYALNNLVCQHELLKMAFEKPWTYGALLNSGSSSSSSSSYS
ncbi:MAG: TolC family protein [Syntrophomonadaceae bacterium]|nr:TolC family protein [Syntrophomonadaceae bacterium]